MGKRDDFQKRVKLGKEMGIKNAMRAFDKERSLANKTQSEDSKNRIEIQKYIKQKCMEGQNKEEISKRLNIVYGTKKYASYRQYFEVWIENAMKKFSPIYFQKEEVER